MVRKTYRTSCCHVPCQAEIALLRVRNSLTHAVTWLTSTCQVDVPDMAFSRCLEQKFKFHHLHMDGIGAIQDRGVFWYFAIRNLLLKINRNLPLKTSTSPQMSFKSTTLCSSTAPHIFLSNRCDLCDIHANRTQLCTEKDSADHYPLAGHFHQSNVLGRVTPRKTRHN